MRIEEIRTEKAIDLSPHNHAFLNPYNGCMMGCPYCYWLSLPGWENCIQVKTNIADILEPYLCSRKAGDYLYLGSVCDPFMELEREYGLTGKCLKLIQRYKVPLVITTSAASNVIVDYIDILKSMGQHVIVVIELSRIPFIEAMNHGGNHAGIVYANKLCKAGLKTWTTLAPLLPGITDLDRVLGALDRKIPIYIDRLRCVQGDLQARRVIEWIAKDYPELFAKYKDMIRRQDWGYFTETLDRSKENDRVKTFPFQL